MFTSYKKLILFVTFVMVCLMISLNLLDAQEMKTLPVYNEAENEDKYPWKPSGLMPDGQGISFQNNFTENCHNGKTCIKLGYKASDNSWVGIYWLANELWEGPGINIYEKLKVNKGAPVRLTFWARGENGGEKAQFKVGGVGKGNDSIKFPVTTGWIKLERNWRQYIIDLSGEDLSNVVGGFCWVTNRNKNRGKEEIWIFLDEIKYEL